jgi:hypothetical protein
MNKKKGLFKIKPAEYHSLFIFFEKTLVLVIKLTIFAPAFKKSMIP